MDDTLIPLKKQFDHYKALADQTFAQLTEAQLLWQYHPSTNSIAMIINHMHGNMLSRWTDFLSTDGEKEWRKRDEEFEYQTSTKAALLNKWEEGWKCLFNALDTLTAADMEKEIYIRNQAHSVAEALYRQLAHYPYHIGQIVFLGTMMCKENWQSLSIPKGASIAFNAEQFAQNKGK